MTKREKEKEEGAWQVLTNPSEQSQRIKRSMLIAIEEREDGLWRCEVVTGTIDSTTPPKSDFKHRREFLRELHRMFEQVRGFVFRGAINRV